MVFTLATDVAADFVVRHRHLLSAARAPERAVQDKSTWGYHHSGEKEAPASLTVFEVLSDQEEARRRVLWPAYLAAKAAGKPAQFSRARLLVDGAQVHPPAR